MVAGRRLIILVLILILVLVLSSRKYRYRSESVYRLVVVTCIVKFLLNDVASKDRGIATRMPINGVGYYKW